jgi:hypothetical protein
MAETAAFLTSFLKRRTAAWATVPLALIALNESLPQTRIAHLVCQAGAGKFNQLIGGGATTQPLKAE